MKNGLNIFLGVFSAMLLSWACLLYGAHRQFGGLTQHKDAADDSLNPSVLPGLANQGRMVYQDLGCVSCHTQQVRHASADLARKWGDRESYPRDYIRDVTVHLGTSRLGPDLRNAGARAPDAAYLYKLLYAPQIFAPGTNKPSYDFLFTVRPVQGGIASPKALELPSKYAPPAGQEVVPTPRAEALVAYLMNLKDSYDYPVEKSRNEPAKKGAGH